MRNDLELPTADEAIASIRATGNPLATAPVLTTLKDVTFADPYTGDLRQVAFDSRVLQKTAALYASDSRLREHLTPHHWGVRPATELGGLLQVAHCSSNLFWGFSGYTSVGRRYDPWVDAMQRIYQHFSSARHFRPRLVSDGGTAAGIPALNSILAEQHDIECIGLTPLQGVDDMGTHDIMLIHGTAYKDLDEIVGTLPDVLVCLGGGAGTQRECLQAINVGNTVVLVMPVTDGPKTFSGQWRTMPEIAEGIANGQVLICTDLDDIPHILATAQDKAREEHLTQSYWRSRRENRIKSIIRMLEA